MSPTSMTDIPPNGNLEFSVPCLHRVNSLYQSNLISSVQLLNVVHVLILELIHVIIVIGGVFCF